MSFSSECKHEICQIKIKEEANARSALGFFVMSAGSVQIGEGQSLLLSNENLSVIRWAAQLIERLYQTQAAILMRETNKLGGIRSYTAVVEGSAVRRILEDFGYFSANGDFFAEENPHALVSNPDQRIHGLRALFLAAGTVNDPIKGYHLEMVFRKKALADAAAAMMNEISLFPKTVPRKDQHVVYLKESEKITSFLGQIGAHSAVLRLEEVWVYRDLRNTLNRQVNCETANLQKTVSAATRQIDNIQWLMKQDAFRSLSQTLKEAAQLRLKYPDATLTELGNLSDPPVGKSGVNHRLRKLDELARSLRG